ncbi:hypothetical protein F5J12DRAFT_786415 [Pisolithus orientalis]|uniref:uncharacterized protein n=1 Tax=Pisolithus orientalis TaxID=936130 RepID=UPI0022253FB8|nr:uncharacterized protein F5J12DRAFT_786415 [Pisolithus orientalis]KAI5991081.1 hypothetical protein F5J12DRAFT_786415 [Pisolithus orientalis]
MDGGVNNEMNDGVNNGVNSQDEWHKANLNPMGEDVHGGEGLETLRVEVLSDKGSTYYAYAHILIVTFDVIAWRIPRAKIPKSWDHVPAAQCPAAHSYSVDFASLGSPQHHHAASGVQDLKEFILPFTPDPLLPTHKVLLTEMLILTHYHYQLLIPTYHYCKSEVHLSSSGVGLTYHHYQLLLLSVQSTHIIINFVHHCHQVYIILFIGTCLIPYPLHLVLLSKEISK